MGTGPPEPTAGNPNAAPTNVNVVAPGLQNAGDQIWGGQGADILRVVHSWDVFNFPGAPRLGNLDRQNLTSDFIHAMQTASPNRTDFDTGEDTYALNGTFV